MSRDAVEQLATLLRGKKVAALTGAGISTESGIPDYRGPETRRRARNPIRFQEYAASHAGRARYWARSMIGWPRMASARPNAAHRALVALEQGGLVNGVVTQNVDRLHRVAGSVRVVELHGALAEVKCLGCGATEARARLQERLEASNPALATATAELAPDGDAELDAALLEGFQVPACEACGGVLKPNVVFFGEGVPRPTVENAYSMVDEADALLVLGSSLAVYSGFRFVKRVHESGRPVALVNLGETRADALAQLRIKGRLGELLPELARALGVNVSGGGGD